MLLWIYYFSIYKSCANGSLSFHCRSRMAAHKVAHATLTGPSVVKEILIGISLGLVAGGLWKMHHWNEQRKTRAFYDLLEKGEISVVAEE
ncbi:probable cytochrome c oxidase subunit 5C-1 isoform X1 [Rhododendron vialii]|uniref:probable cytochrome c oxidase subunit 5C-1 isoform X1 n=1 Tax=Rhododendron vialii TaxID=182163 RepID=UPI00265EF3C3|nr:probable cytochrome c oxidase subunit 5C-1 isoform X1 [Rhododendron vialii]